MKEKILDFLKENESEILQTVQAGVAAELSFTKSDDYVYGSVILNTIGYSYSDLAKLANLLRLYFNRNIKRTLVDVDYQDEVNGPVITFLLTPL